MRIATRLLGVLALATAPAAAQQRPSTSTTQPATPPAASASSVTPPAEAEQLRGRGVRSVPPATNLNYGDRAVAAGRTISGSVAVARGNLDVFGKIDGDAYVVGGDIRIHPGGEVTGNAITTGGRVVVDGGTVGGEMRSLGSGRAPAAKAPRQPLTTVETVKLVLGWFAVLVILGIGVMVFAEANLDGVVLALERGVGRAFWIGLAGELLALPALLVVVVALAITILGALLIPFAIVAYVVAAAGLLTLGFLAVSRLAGTAMVSDSGTVAPRGVHLRALFVGLAIVFGLWLLAAAFTWSPLVGGILRAIAIATTWVAATVGLGGTLISRAGTQRPGVATTATKASDEYAWQTPTPVTGVAAARRATSTTAR